MDTIQIELQNLHARIDKIVERLDGSEKATTDVPPETQPAEQSNDPREPFNWRNP